MANQWNASLGFHRSEEQSDNPPNSSLSGHQISFQPGVMNFTSSEIVPLDPGVERGSHFSSGNGGSSGGDGMSGNYIMNSGHSSSNVFGNNPGMIPGVVSSSLISNSRMIAKVAAGSGVIGNTPTTGEEAASSRVIGSGARVVQGTAASSLVGNSPRIVQGAGAIGACSSGSLFHDVVPGLRHNTGLAIRWTPEEHHKLKEGLVKFANETTLEKHIKIAATLHDKTVRDVAIRCKWMAGIQKKSKAEAAGKKVNIRKDKLLESKMNTSAATPVTIRASSSMMPQTGQNEGMHFEGSKTTYLLEQNAQLLSLINANLSALQLYENIELFWCARNNITTVLNDMGVMPGVRREMPPLPVSIDQDLANQILPTTQEFGGGTDGDSRM